MGFSERHTTERNEKAPKKRRGPFMITEVHQEGRFYRLNPAEPLMTQPIDRRLVHTCRHGRGGLPDDGPCL